MGMAASQARLLTITARMHDIEYQAQSIQDAKLALATQSDEVYKDYLAALDSTTLTVKDWQGNTYAANFNNLCGINAVDSGNFRFALRDSHNRLIVSDEIAVAYSKFTELNPQGDAYEFAMFMLGGDMEDTQYKCDEHGENVYTKAFNTVESRVLKNNETLSEMKDSIDRLTDQKLRANGASDLWTEDKDYELDALLEKYNYQMNRAYCEDIYGEIYGETSSEYFDNDDFEYYCNIFKQIQANGGSCISIDSCVSIGSYDGFDGDASNDEEWLHGMIQSGKITIDRVTTNTKNGKITFASTGVPSDSNLEYTTTSTIDKSALAKAEAEYEHKTKEIDRKDKKFDMDLSKLETQRTALKTEYESVKKVIEENIDRTFGIFS